MAKCSVCGKLRMAGQNVSHANNVTKRSFKPNLQSVRALVDGRAQKVMVCTRCLRGGKILKAVRGRKATFAGRLTPSGTAVCGPAPLGSRAAVLRGASRLPAPWRYLARGDEQLAPLELLARQRVQRVHLERARELAVRLGAAALPEQRPAQVGARRREARVDLPAPRAAAPRRRRHPRP